VNTVSPRDIVIVGAPRSGTNMLRDVLTSLPAVTTWPCDEVNLMWKYGNRGVASDELTPQHATPDVRAYIRSRFEQIRRRHGARVVVEKTCATSLRVGFAMEVLPDATFVLITRDGIDAAASAMRRWHAPFNVRYAAAKARFVPVRDLAWHGRRFAAEQVRRRASRSEENADRPGVVSTWWGPRPHDYRRLMLTRPLDEICALQWQRCVEAAWGSAQGLTPERVVHVRYEDFVADPVARAEELVQSLGLTGAPVVDGIRPHSVGKGRAQLGPGAVTRLESLVGSTLGRVHRD